MAREFAKSEIIRQKCSICGSKNKRFVELVQDGKMCGYELICCNCNHIDTFFNDMKVNTKTNIKRGREVCIHVSPCGCNPCIYYKKYSLSYAARLLDRILNGYGTDCLYDNGMKCSDCEFADICPNKNKEENKYNIENLDTHQLVINGYTDNNPKFH